MIDRHPPSLIGFEKPAIIRPAGELWKPPQFFCDSGKPKKAMPWEFVYVPSGAATVLTKTYEASYVLTTTLTTHTFAACDIGAAASDRLVVVSVEAANPGTSAGRSISSALIDGGAATLNATINSTNWGAIAGVVSRIVAAGTTADISVTFSGAVEHCSISVYRIVGYSSATPSTTDPSALPARPGR